MLSERQVQIVIFLKTRSVLWRAQDMQTSWALKKVGPCREMGSWVYFEISRTGLCWSQVRFRWVERKELDVQYRTVGWAWRKHWNFSRRRALKLGWALKLEWALKLGWALKLEWALRTWFVQSWRSCQFLHFLWCVSWKFRAAWKKASHFGQWFDLIGSQDLSYWRHGWRVSHRRNGCPHRRYIVMGPRSGFLGSKTEFFFKTRAVLAFYLMFQTAHVPCHYHLDNELRDRRPTVFVIQRTWVWWRPATYPDNSQNFLSTEKYA